MKPGDLLRITPKNQRIYYVYELIDDDCCIFYVGMSHDPASRLLSHCSKPSISTTPSARAVMDRVRANPGTVMRIVSVHGSKFEALQAETLHASSFAPGVLLNAIIPGFHCAQYARHAEVQ